MGKQEEMEFNETKNELLKRLENAKEKIQLLENAVNASTSYGELSGVIDEIEVFIPSVTERVEEERVKL